MAESRTGDGIAAGVWMELLDPDECWSLLASATVGRLGVLVDSAPEIYPLNYVVDGRSVLFRSSQGAKLRGLDRNPSVCFEVDSINETDATGWSVMVKGRAAELHRPEDIARAETLPLRVWTIGQAGLWVQITPRDVTGRRIGRQGAAVPD